MKTNTYTNSGIMYLLLWVLSVVVQYGCAEDAAPVLYNEFKGKGTPDPVVGSILPENYAYAGLDTITINGSNFTDTSHTAVYFNSTKASLISVTPTQIRLKAPTLSGDSVIVRVVVSTAPAYAPPVKYALKQILITYYNKYTYYDGAVSVAFDKLGNLYVSQVNKGFGVGVKKIDSGGNLSDYAPKGAETSWGSLKFAYGPYGTGGQLFGARKNKGIWKINPGEAPAAQPWVGPGQGIDQNINDFDLDPSGNIWAAGAGTNIFRIKADKSVQKFKYATSSKINAVRIFKNPDNTLYLYAGGTKDGKEGIWRYKIQNDEIAQGSEELYYDFGAAYPGKSVLGLTFSADGSMYLGTSSDETIIVVSPTKDVNALFPGVIMPKFLSFAWDSYDKTNGKHLIYLRDVTASETEKDYAAKIFLVVTFKQGAPYYGLEL